MTDRRSRLQFAIGELAPVLAAWLLSRFLLVQLLLRDVDSGDGVAGLTHRWATELAGGDSPYHEVGVAYPPLAMWLFLVPAIGGVGPGTYQATFAAFILAADLAGLLLAWRAERDGARGAALRYTLAVPAAGAVLLLWRYDLLPALAHLTAAWLLLRGNRRASWLALGVAVALKPYTAVAVPLWVVWELRARRAPLRDLATGGALVLAPSLLGLVSMLPVAGADVLLPYTFQLHRGVTLDSTPGLALAALGDPTRVEAVFAQGCLCWERAGPGADLVGTLGTVAGAIGIAAIVGWAWRRGTGQAAVAGSAAAVLVLLLTSPVFSPQYVLWPLPVLALTGRRGALVAAAVAAGLAGLSYPTLAGDLITGTWVGDALTWSRVGALLVALVLLLRDRPAQARAGSRSGAGPPTGPTNRSATR